MVIKTKTVYEASDGTTFNSMKDAQAHQNSIELNAARLYNDYLRVKGLSDTDPSLVDFSVWLVRLAVNPNVERYVRGTYREAIKYACTLTGFWDCRRPGSIIRIKCIDLSNAKEEPSEERHPNCRNWCEKNGEAFPRSSCYECGSVISPNFKCKYGIE